MPRFTLILFAALGITAHHTAFCWRGRGIAALREDMVSVEAGAKSEQDVLRNSSFASSPSPRRVLAVFVAVPVTLTHPIAAAVLPGSWDAMQGPEGWFQYGYTLVLVGGALASNIMSSYTGEAAQRASQLLLAQLSAEAARAQGFLETAMPSYVAQALLSRVPDAELTVSSESATVAFVALTRFDELTAQQPPAKLMEVCAAASAKR